MKKTFLVILFIVTTALSAFAGSTYYEKGDTLFIFRAGIDLPAYTAFIHDPDLGTKVGISGTSINLGGYADISYQGFLTNNIALGAELGYAFNYPKSREIFTTVPITAKLTYIPVQTGKFDLDLSVNAGIAVLKNAGSNTPFVCPHIFFGVNPQFFITNTWGLGIETGLWTNFEMYPRSSSHDKYFDSCIAGFVPVTVTLTYRH